MPFSAKKDLLPEISPLEEHEDELDFGSLDDLASLMVEALTIPMAADFAGTAQQVSETAEPSTKTRN